MNTLDTFISYMISIRISYMIHHDTHERKFKCSPSHREHSWVAADWSGSNMESKAVAMGTDFLAGYMLPGSWSKLLERCGRTAATKRNQHDRSVIYSPLSATMLIEPSSSTISRYIIWTSYVLVPGLPCHTSVPVVHGTALQKACQLNTAPNFDSCEPLVVGWFITCTRSAQNIFTNASHHSVSAI